MSATPQDVQAKIDAGLAEIKKATSAPSKMVAQHGSDPAAWPNGHLKTGFTTVLAAKAEAGQLVAPAAPKAAFTSHTS